MLIKVGREWRARLYNEGPMCHSKSRVLRIVHQSGITPGALALFLACLRVACFVLSEVQVCYRMLSVRVAFAPCGNIVAAACFSNRSSAALAKHPLAVPHYKTRFAHNAIQIRLRLQITTS